MDFSLSALPLSVALLLGIVYVARADQVEYCQEPKTCPNFTITNKTKDFEERAYVRTLWICTEVESESLSHITAAHGRLAKFYGDNEMNTETWPVRIKVEKVAENQYNFEMCFFVDPDDEKKLPKLPKRYPEQVTLDEVPPTTYYVSRFGGRPSMETGKKNADLLKKHLDAAHLHYKQNFAAEGYEGYFAMSHHNEIWDEKEP